MKSLDIRKKFFDFFVKNGHHKAESSSLIPAQDPTLLFTNAGMNQFKDLFLGNEQRSYKTAVSIQKCVRAGGKHNDLDNVGFTKRHLTFFEMMGNFSFGDYFKKEAIHFAWTFLTKELGLNPHDMFVSVYKEDDEAFDIWNKEMGVPAERIMRFDKKDNFWQMGDVGPCGPCTEIYVDLRTPEERKKLPVYQDFEDGKLLEIWNLVFMQFDMQPDGSLKRLKHTGVDTGMGLERVTCIMQGKDTVYHTDLFTPLIKAIEKLSGLEYDKQDAKVKAAFHVLADHVRSTSLIIADGGSPSNEGRGYVLRKIIRRAALFAQKLSDKNIFPELAKAFIQELSPVYPELKTNQTMIVSLLTHEIEQFSQNLIRGQAILETFFKEQAHSKTITGEQAFKLYDTYGFPLEVTILSCQERGYNVDTVAFEECMEKQRELSGKKMKATKKAIELPENITTTFVGYQTTQATSPIIGIITDDTLHQHAKAHTPCWVITKECPFFVTTGGQVDDVATVTIHGKTMPVTGLQKIGSAIAFQITPEVALSVGDSADQHVNISIRKMTANNHTATHLLQAALIELFGKQVKQSGSVVDPNYLRFDFTYHKNLTVEEVTHVENRVNDIIRENIPVSIFETTYKKALDHGAIAIFGEKYNPECVRVIDVPGFSTELCGGTHVPTTGVIGAFKIIEVSALSAGNRRIFAVTGPKAVELMQQNFNMVKTLSQEFKVKPEEVVAAVEKQKEALNKAQLELRNLKKQVIVSHVHQWAQQAHMIGKIPFVYLSLDGYTTDDLREAATLLQQHQKGLYVLTSSADEKTNFYASLAPELATTLDFETVKNVLDNHGLKGGGKAGTLQGGGPRLTKDLKAALLKALA